MRQPEELARALDDCLERLSRGERLEDCLRAYPQYAGELRAYLETAKAVKQAHGFTPSAEARTRARARLQASLAAQAEKQPARPWWRGLAGWGWAAAAVTVTAAVTLLLVLRGGAPGVPPIIPTPDPQGNFVFLISDAPNAIADFSRLDVTLEKVALIPAAGGQQVEFTPEVRVVDLVPLPGEATQAVWQGNVPAGDYRAVVLYVSQVQGTLKAGGMVAVKLPSDKLRVDASFTVGGAEPVRFVFDLTVNRTGNGKNGKYMLKPVAAESGVQPASTHPQKSNGKT